MPQVLIISNRLPVSVKKEDGQLRYSASVGGLATGLSSFVSGRRNKWIGWPGIASDELSDKDRKAITRELAKSNCIPVFLSQKQIDDFYNGYSNAILWPMFHNLKPAKVSEQDYRRWWRAYQTVNREFAEAALSVAQTRSQIWVHDYQLLLLPDLLRQEKPEANIGFFLHIPFPDDKTFGQIAEHTKLLQGVLGAGLVGFHTTGYVRNFLANCQAYTKASVGTDQVVNGSHITRVANFPMGIDYDKYATASKTKAVRAAMRKYQKRYKGRRVIVAVDRLDPTKGLVERLKAYRDFLAANPKQHGKVVFSMVAAPSRTEIDAYKNLKQKLDKLAVEINETYGTDKWQPLDYMNISLPFEEVTALFKIADVAFIAPLKDGMNLVAKEYVASRQKNGVLILSETAGAAEELRDALLVNPRKPATLVNALQDALTMPKGDLKQRMNNMHQHLASNTVHTWAGNFVKAMQPPLTSGSTLARAFNARTGKQIFKHYDTALKRLIVLDYDGSLVPFTDDYRTGRSSKSLIHLLEKIAADPRNELIIISGRSIIDLESKLPGDDYTLIAEHGAAIKHAGSHDWDITKESDPKWQEDVLPLLEYYAALTPGAHVETKDHSLVWHYRESPAYYAQKYGVVLRRALKPLLKKHHLKVYQGNKILEIKNPRLTKGRALKPWLQRKHDFVLIVGDDYTDETMFAVAPAESFTVKVGRGRTLARYRISDDERIRELLKQLTD